jgi:hypothetical protein
MEKITGLIEDVELPHGFNNDGKTISKRYVFTIDGKKYSTFDSQIGSNYLKGMNVVMEGEIIKGFWNMKTMMPASDAEHKEEYVKHGVTPHNQETVKVEGNQTSFRGDRENKIIAQCMIKVEYRNCATPKPLDIMESYNFYLKTLNNG